MTVDTALERQPVNSLYAALSQAIVKCMREYTGRGPTKARTTIRDNVVLVMLEQTLTKGEQVLVTKGRAENVLQLRREYQEAMRDESSDIVAELTGRHVIAMMSANHIDPDLAAEIYVLDGPPNHPATSSTLAAITNTNLD
ncbi:MAG: Na-translocating system protein MpsC family protein [Solirubrobacteraceae bacterium]